MGQRTAGMEALQAAALHFGCRRQQMALVMVGVLPDSWRSQLVLLACLKLRDLALQLISCWPRVCAGSLQVWRLALVLELMLPGCCRQLQGQGLVRQLQGPAGPVQVLVPGHDGGLCPLALVLERQLLGCLLPALAAEACRQVQALAQPCPHLKMQPTQAGNQAQGPELSSGQAPLLSAEARLQVQAPA